MAVWWKDNSRIEWISELKEIRVAGSKYYHLLSDIVGSISEKDNEKLNTCLEECIKQHFKSERGDYKFPMAAIFLRNLSTRKGFKVMVSEEAGKYLFHLPKGDQSMGCTTYGIGVSISRIETLIDSKDLEYLSVEMPNLDPDLNRTIEGDSYSAESALRDLIACDLSRSKAVPHIFVYSVEALCNHFGNRFDGDGSINSLEDLDWELDFEELTTYLGISPTNVFPNAQIVKLSQVKQQFERFEDSTDHSEGYIVDGREEYVWWLKQCIDANTDLVTFCY